MADDAQIQLALEQIRFARGYVNRILDDLPPEAWFWQPVEGVTHVAWQVGHLATAQYGLALKRLRGEQPEDEALISAAFRQAFGKGSTPGPADQSPSVEEIRATFDRVYEQVLAEVPQQTDAELDVPLEGEHPAFKTKLGALQFCSQHEMTHAGQIALLRRMTGRPPLF